MKIFESKAIAQIDRETIRLGRSENELICRAASSFIGWLMPRISRISQVTCLCGPGNNGADGLEIAYQLSAWGYCVDVVCFEFGKKSQGYAFHKSKIVASHIPYRIFQEAPTQWQFTMGDVVIDALLGNGLNRVLEFPYKDLVMYVNAMQKEVYAVDVPTGMMTTKEIEGCIMRCRGTFSFEFLRKAFFLREAYAYTGDFQYGSIGLSIDVIQKVGTSTFMTDRSFVRKYFKKRSPHSYKRDYGHTLLIGGSEGMTGSIVLCARAAIASGVGLCTVVSDKKNRTIVQSSLPEAMFKALDGGDINWDQYTIAIGCGLGQQESAYTLLERMLQSVDRPIVIDADALNILGRNRDLWNLLPRGSILTPHIGEFHRLFGRCSTDYERIELLRISAHKYNVHIVLKGKYTQIASPNGELYFNSTGNPGMATGGSGDVLSGIICGFLAQGYDAQIAAIVGVYLHGLSGDLAALKLGMSGLSPSSIIDFLSDSIKKVQ